MKYIGNILLRQKMAKQKGIRKMCNFDTAKSVGVLFVADTVESYQRVSEFTDTLLNERGIKVLTIGYVVDKKKQGDFNEKSGYRFFSTKQCNWYGKPNDHSVDYFVEKEFDMLIDLSLSDYLPLQFIVASSKTRLRVGRFSSSYVAQDVMIDINKNNTVDYLITQIELYLSMLKVEQKKES